NRGERRSEGRRALRANRSALLLLREREIQQVEELAERVGVRLTSAPPDLVTKLDRALDGRTAAIEKRVDRYQRLVAQVHRLAHRLGSQSAQAVDPLVEHGHRVARGAHTGNTTRRRDLRSARTGTRHRRRRGRGGGGRGGSTGWRRH